ncbi:glycosyltransferase family 87 protein [Micrococcoides hystricis]|uniref:Glycosyltransferase family 87 protein n=1 Tax=Micrococcoides hystricis TaxID=1572761 RepID=A0ABV6PD10_9MICC
MTLATFMLARVVPMSLSSQQQRPGRTEGPSAVVPTQDDPVLASSTTLLGGPWGTRAAAAIDKTHFFTLSRVLVILTTLAAVAAVLTKQHCLLNGAGSPGVYLNGCYSDWTALYSSRGLADQPWAPFTTAEFEYPVLMSVVASLTAALVPGPWVGDGAAYFGVNFLFAFILWVVTVLLTAKTARWRPWDAVMVAIAPGIIFAGSINWDIWAVTLLAAAMWAASRGKTLWLGVFIGLGAAMKLYPLFLLGALLILTVRDKSYLRFAKITAAAAGAWLAVNLPLMIGNWDAFAKFYTFSSERGASWSSIWHVWNLMAEKTGNTTLDADAVGVLATGGFALSCAVIFIFGVRSQHRPRLAQLMFLIVAAFILFNKVYSPQFVIWLVPLVALASPRWLDFIVWQLIEVAHFWAIWMLLARYSTQDWPDSHRMDESVYVFAVLAHVVMVLWLCYRVIADIRDPKQDPVLRAHLSDPGYRFSPADEEPQKSKKAFTSSG